MPQQLEPIQVTPQQNRNVQLALRVVTFPFQTMRAIAALILILFVLAIVAYYPIPSILVGAGAAILYIKRKSILRRI
jgi:hypothetical protein